MKLPAFIKEVKRVVCAPEVTEADKTRIVSMCNAFERGISCENCIHGNVVNGTEYCKDGSCKKFNKFEPKGLAD